MIIVATVGRDVKRAELRLELVLKTEDSPTPVALSGSGPARFRILHASPEERALLLAHGIALEDVDLKWAELHHRQPVKTAKRITKLARAATNARANTRKRAATTTNADPSTEPIPALAA